MENGFALSDFHMNFGGVLDAFSLCACICVCYFSARSFICQMAHMYVHRTHMYADTYTHMVYNSKLTIRTA